MKKFTCNKVSLRYNVAMVTAGIVMGSLSGVTGSGLAHAASNDFPGINLSQPASPSGISRDDNRSYQMSVDIRTPLVINAPSKANAPIRFDVVNDGDIPIIPDVRVYISGREAGFVTFSRRNSDKRFMLMPGQRTSVSWEWYKNKDGSLPECPTYRRMNAREIRKDSRRPDNQEPRFTSFEELDAHNADPDVISDYEGPGYIIRSWNTPTKNDAHNADPDVISDYEGPGYIIRSWNTPTKNEQMEIVNLGRITSPVVWYRNSSEVTRNQNIWYSYNPFLPGRVVVRYAGRPDPDSPIDPDIPDYPETNESSVVSLTRLGGGPISAKCNEPIRRVNHQYLEPIYRIGKNANAVYYWEWAPDAELLPPPGRYTVAVADMYGFVWNKGHIRVPGRTNALSTQPLQPEQPAAPPKPPVQQPPKPVFTLPVLTQGPPSCTYSVAGADCSGEGTGSSSPIAPVFDSTIRR